MSREILLLVDALAREKNVDKEVVFGALEHALREGRPGAAAIDVFETEPLPPTAALLQLDFPAQMSSTMLMLSMNIALRFFW